MRNNRLNSVSDFLRKYESSERFSNFNQNELAFNQNELAFAPQRKPVSKSYVVNIVNSTAGILDAVLFGYNDFSLSPTTTNPYTGVAGALNNFGNPAGITITTSAPNTTYARLMAQSQDKPFEIGMWRMSSNQATTQFAQVFEANYVDANGRSAADPITLSDYLDPYQQQTTIIEFVYPVKVDGNTFFIIPIVGNSTLSVNMFPQDIADLGHHLVSGQSTKSFDIPRLSARNATIVQAQGVISATTPIAQANAMLNSGNMTGM